MEGDTVLWLRVEDKSHCSPLDSACTPVPGFYMEPLPLVLKAPCRIL